MPGAPRRGPGKRLLLTLAALASLIVGYYLGQSWQRQPLDGLSAVVYPNGKRIELAADTFSDSANDDVRPWRLFTTVDTDRAACRELRDDYALVINRLAHRPALQARVRVAMLAYDRPDAQAGSGFATAYPWLDLIAIAAPQRDRLAAELGILPTTDDWCRGPQASAILVAPDAVAWALIPHEQADIMAHNIITLIDFVE